MRNLRIPSTFPSWREEQWISLGIFLKVPFLIQSISQLCSFTRPSTQTQERRSTPVFLRPLASNRRPGPSCSASAMTWIEGCGLWSQLQICTKLTSPLSYLMTLSKLCNHSEPRVSCLQNELNNSASPHQVTMRTKWHSQPHRNKATSLPPLRISPVSQ